jgi:mRNA-degrading endonuclease RelE of RelBE toxin-antitoxin system
MVKALRWTPRSKADVRAIDSLTAIRILRGLAHFTQTGEGDVQRLKDVDPPQSRLRVGDYRIRFRDYGNSIEILSVKHRSEAYR